MASTESTAYLCLQAKLSVNESDGPGIVKGMDTIGQRITYLRETILDMTQEQFAKALSVSRGAVGNWERDKPVSRKSITEISRAFNVDADWLLSGVGRSPDGGLATPESRRQRGHDIDGFERADTARIPIRGEVAAGQWLETVPFLDDIDITDWMDGIAVAPSMEKFTYCLRVKGTSMNKVAPDGAFLICLDMMAGIDVFDRDVVIVERIRDQGALREVTAKRLTRRGDEMVLTPESTDPMWQKEIIIKPDAADMDAEVRIVAKVKHVILPL